MSWLILPHESGSQCLFDVDNQSYYLLPKRNKQFDLFESVDEFLQSNKPTAIIPFYCMEKKIDGKRYFVSMACRSNITRIFNIENINNSWRRNEKDKRPPTHPYFDKSAPKTGIEICEPGKAYFIYCVKEKDSNIGFRVKSVKEIKKAG